MSDNDKNDSDKQNNDKQHKKGRELFVWFDMEMTGLDPVTCVPLEVGVIITNQQLEELESLEFVIFQPESKLELMDPFVQKMHTDNGLLKKVRKSEIGMHDAEIKLIEFIAKWTKPRAGVLAGNSIHQDRRFLEAYFPAVDRYLHYRMIDVSTVKELARRWYGDKAKFHKAEAKHTAIEDIRASIAELRYYRDKAFVKEWA